MKKRITNYLVILLSSILGLTIAFYLVVAVLYREGFTYGTYINGVYCTAKTIGEVNSELIKREDIGQIKVSSDYSEDEFIDLCLKYPYIVNYFDWTTTEHKSCMYTHHNYLPLSI